MDDVSFSKKLRNLRIYANKTVQDVSKFLIARGKKASEKTIYSWETGRSQPTPDALLDMCTFYEVKDVLAAFGYKKISQDEVEESTDFDELERIYFSLNIEGQNELLKHARLLAKSGDYNAVSCSVNAKKPA